MKKYNVPILISIFVIVNASFLFVAKANSFGLVADGENTYYTSAFGYPHTEIEIFSFHTSGASQGNIGFKKVSGYFTYNTKRLFYCPFYSPVYCSSGSIDLKQYLSHIYPSHNFW